LKKVHNISASIKQRLLNKARSENIPFQQLLQYYAMERFLYRIGQSQYSEKFILKGALLLLAWDAPQSRPTKDIDMSGQTSNDTETILSQMKEVLEMDLVEDGIIFDVKTLSSESITDDADYNGIRVIFQGHLESARIHMQIDIGFGDIIYPKPEKKILPAILDLPSPEVLCYSIESSIAEKFEAMIKLGIFNSRMKDFYDIWFLSRQFIFKMSVLGEAISRTFTNRSTELSTDIILFSNEFIEEKQVQWNAFCKRIDKDNTLPSFDAVVKSIKEFIIPVLQNQSSDKTDEFIWKPSGPWEKG
jgi:predicted nucleotidyltransferase component of viral defense system